MKFTNSCACSLTPPALRSGLVARSLAALVLLRLTNSCASLLGCSGSSATALRSASGVVSPLGSYTFLGLGGRSLVPDACLRCAPARLLRLPHPASLANALVSRRLLVRRSRSLFAQKAAQSSFPHRGSFALRKRRARVAGLSSLAFGSRSSPGFGAPSRFRLLAHAKGFAPVAKGGSVVASALLSPAYTQKAVRSVRSRFFRSRAHGFSLLKKPPAA